MEYIIDLVLEYTNNVLGRQDLILLLSGIFFVNGALSVAAMQYGAKKRKLAKSVYNKFSISFVIVAYVWNMEIMFVVFLVQVLASILFTSVFCLVKRLKSLNIPDELERSGVAFMPSSRKFKEYNVEIDKFKLAINLPVKNTYE